MNSSCEKEHVPPVAVLRFTLLLILELDTTKHLLFWLVKAKDQMDV